MKSMDISRQNTEPSQKYMQSLHLTDKELNELLQGSSKYGEKVNIKLLREKMSYIEKTYKETQGKEALLNQKEIECIFIMKHAFITVNLKHDELEKMRHLVELRELEIKNKELALEARENNYSSNNSARKQQNSISFPLSLEKTEKPGDLQMKETLLSEQAVLLSEKEQEISNREKILHTKE